jgi:hypothetical protein
MLAAPAGIAILTVALGQAAPASSPKTEVVEPDILWAHAYGNDDLFAADVIQTSDGNFAVTGQYQYFSPNGEDSGGAIYLLKVGAGGLKLQQTLDDYGLRRFYGGVFVHETEDQGLIVAGYGTKLIPPPYFYLAKYDADGAILWNKEYRPATGNGNCMCTAATATPDGGYLMIGYTGVAPGVENVYVVKTDALGTMEWDTIISDAAGLGNTTEIARSVTVAPGGYAITGEVTDQETTLTSAFLLRLNFFGKVIAKKHYNFLLPGTEKTDVDGRSIQYTKDGFIIAGSAIGYSGLDNPRAGFLLKVSINGQVRWTKIHGLETNSSAWSVAETPDGGYILAGDTRSVPGSSSHQAYIVRTDRNGDELWSKTISGGDYVPYATAAASKIIVTSDGGYILTGMAVPAGAADTLLVRIEPDIVAKK